MSHKFKKRVVLTVADEQKFVTDYDAFHSTVISPLIGGNGKAQLNIDVYTLGDVDFVKGMLGHKEIVRESDRIKDFKSVNELLSNTKYHTVVKSLYYHMIRISDIIEMSIEDVCFEEVEE